jgi:hypothetical protein
VKVSVSYAQWIAKSSEQSVESDCFAAKINYLIAIEITAG